MKAKMRRRKKSNTDLTLSLQMSTDHVA